jgi:hypothetical protein
MPSVNNVRLESSPRLVTRLHSSSRFESTFRSEKKQMKMRSATFLKFKPPNTRERTPLPVETFFESVKIILPVL